MRRLAFPRRYGKVIPKGALTNGVQVDWPMDWRAPELLI